MKLRLPASLAVEAFAQQADAGQAKPSSNLLVALLNLVNFHELDRLYD